jgi:exonuclease SbcC
MRSIVLAQGDFAAFLHAKEDERAGLLEKMTGTEIYSQISIAAFEKAKQEDQKFKDLEKALDNIQLMPDQELQALKSAMEAGRGVIEQGQGEINRLREHEAWLVTLTSLEVQRQQSQAALDTARQDHEAIQADIARLTMFEKALHHKGQLDVLEEKKKQAHDMTQKIAALNCEIPDLQKECENQTTQKQASHVQLNLAKKQKADMEQLIDTVIAKDKDIGNQKKLVMSIEGNLNSLKAQQKERFSLKRQIDTKIVASQGEIERLETWLTENKGDQHLANDIPWIQDRLKSLMDIRTRLHKLIEDNLNISANLKAYEQAIPVKEGQALQKKDQAAALQQSLTAKEGQIKDTLREAESLEAVDNEMERLNDLLHLYDKLSTLSTGYQRSLRESQENTNNHMELTQQYNELQKTAAVLNEQKALQEQFIQSLEQRVKKEMLIANYEQARRELRDNEPCPLCGSIHHPYATNEPVVNTGLQQDLDGQKEKLNSLSQSLKEREIHVAKVETKLKESDKNHQRFDKLKQELIQNWETACARLEQPVSIQDEAALAQKIATCKKTLENKREIVKTVRDMKSAFDRANQQLVKEQREMMKLEQELENLKLKREHGLKDACRLSSEIEETQRIEAQRYQLLAHSLQLYSEKLPEANLENQLIERLQARSTAYMDTLQSIQKQKDNLQNLQSDVKSLSTAITTMEEQVERRAQELQEARQGLGLIETERHDLFGTKEPWQERKNLEQAIDAAEKSLQEVQDRLNKAQKAYDLKTEMLTKTKAELETAGREITDLEMSFLTLIEKTGFPDIGTFKAALLSPEEHQAIAKKRDEIHTRIIQSETRLRQIQENLDREQAKQLTDELLDTVKTRLEEKTRVLEEQKNAFSRHQVNLEQQIERKMKYAEVQQGLERQKLECRKWGMLKNLIGSADGKEFRKFAQGLTLERLLWLANRHLLKLHDRYYLVKKEGDDLGFEVVDTYQADIRRPTTTLSGGESFLVSLALALGLSELASRNTRIDSFFLDEGFGTLDTVTLDSALSTLENLQATGKVIGVISHVEALKERIYTQIQVEKLSGGISQIQIVG